VSNETVVGGAQAVPPQPPGPTSLQPTSPPPTLPPPSAPPILPQVTGTDHTIQTPGTGVFERDQLVGHGDLTPQLIDTPVWTDDMVAKAGIPIFDVPFVSVGGGMGSFIMVDHLRISGVPASQIAVLGVNPHPWDTYEYLTRVSQVPRGERLRSDSQSSPDNIWGFPSLALREAWHGKKGYVTVATGLKKQSTVAAKLAPLYNVLTEPILTDYFTPRAGDVFSGIEREAARIGYQTMIRQGLVRMVRRRSGAGYFTILTPPAGASPTKRVAFRSRWVHIAVGYPGLRFLPDLQEYRTKYEDYTRVVNAYESHEHVYDELVRRPCTVVVRGGGIVASRVLQRLMDDRNLKGAQTTVIHLLRHYAPRRHGPSRTKQRKGAYGTGLQGFNWPKSDWGGQYKRGLEKATPEKRVELLGWQGGTTTPHRKLWLKQLANGERGGYFRQLVGKVTEVKPTPDGRILTMVETAQGPVNVPSDFIIDATGLESDINEHRLLKDLFDMTGAQRSPYGRLSVGLTFEIDGTRNGDGRVYGAGSATLGGPYATVDSFLGLNYQSLVITKELAKQGFGKGLGPARSISQWWKWMRHQQLP
jgi:hypothetical protein